MTLIFGVLPLAFATGVRSELRQALGTVILSGIIGKTETLKGSRNG